jgi:hypothetical protein
MRPFLEAASLFAIGLVTALSLAGCGGATTDLFLTTSDDGSAPPNPDASSPHDDAGHPTPIPTYAPGCPTSVPADGSPCSAGFGFTCEYGADPHCTKIAACASDGQSGTFTWFVTSSDSSCSGNPAECPKSFGAAKNESPCANTDDSCTYSEGRCGCVSCESNESPNGGMQQWVCETWETPTACPEPRPLLGTSCSSEGQECDYGPSCCDEANIGPAMLCTGGYWTDAEVGCECGVELCSE